MEIPQEVLDQFKDAFDSEEYLVSAIKQYLRTEEQRKWLYDHDLSIEDCLNGRYPGDLEEEVAEVLYKPWNEILGFREFGS